MRAPLIFWKFNVPGICGPPPIAVDPIPAHAVATNTVTRFITTTSRRRFEIGLVHFFTVVGALLPGVDHPQDDIEQTASYLNRIDEAHLPFHVPPDVSAHAECKPIQPRMPTLFLRLIARVTLAHRHSAAVPADLRPVGRENPAGIQRRRPGQTVGESSLVSHFPIGAVDFSPDGAITLVL